MKRRGNPAWYKGMVSANPAGRPRGRTSYQACCQDPSMFFIKQRRWWRFCFALLEPPYTGAAAARKAGYSPKSARFIASRLWKKPAIRKLHRKINEASDSRNPDIIYKDWE